MHTLDWLTACIGIATQYVATGILSTLQRITMHRYSMHTIDLNSLQTTLVMTDWCALFEFHLQEDDERMTEAARLEVYNMLAEACGTNPVDTYEEKKLKYRHASLPPPYYS